ncbi:uncharacterized protein LOC129600932 [Paramacrobiotus metropolitanus]|uniref:uncharacterized protein LOC129600932 n=1 Tax=Paramacrobiotus metropolitanus TaxID=2943436 RepID=UPI00244640C0|nr:uncharacterized protein LOC129600932 [Paramacrobiotus metropolitanus]
MDTLTCPIKKRRFATKRVIPGTLSTCKIATGSPGSSPSCSTVTGARVAESVGTPKSDEGSDSPARKHVEANRFSPDDDLRLLPQELFVERDISQGKERFQIAAINCVDTESLSPFTYITVRHMAAQLRDVVKASTEKFKTCCSKDTCWNKCHYDTCPCRLYSGEGITYQNDLLVYNKMEAYDNSTMIIRECGSACCCQKKKSVFRCGNRVFAKKSKVQVEIFKTADRGWGVRTREALREGQYIGEYTGIIGEETKQSGDYILSLGQTIDGVDMSVNAESKGNFTRFINHSCFPNLFMAKIVGDCWTPGLPHLCLFTVCDVAANEELLLDYGPDYWAAKGEEGIACRCGEKDCKYGGSLDQKENSD